MSIAYSYLRFSTARQAQGDSERRQIEAAARYATKEGITLDESLSMSDKGLSAYAGANRRQGALGTFLAAIEAERVPHGSILIVEALDRLTREPPFVAIKTMIAILQAGIEIHTLEDGMKYSISNVDSGEFTKMAGKLEQAYFYSRRLGMRVGASWEAKRKNLSEGKIVSKHCPGWLRVVDGKYEVIEERAVVVRRIFAEAINGFGCIKITRNLNADNVPVFTRYEQGINYKQKESIWQQSYVKSLLRSRASIGYFQPHKIVQINEKKKRVPEGEAVKIFPPVIDVSTWEKANASKIAKRAGRKGAYGNLLSGLCRCLSCGGPMTFRAVGNTQHRYLVCNVQLRNGNCAEKTTYRYQQLEALLLSSLAIFGSLNEDLFKKNETGPYEGKIASLNNNLSQKRMHIENLLDGFSDGITRAVAQRIKKLESEVEIIEDEIVKLKNSEMIRRGSEQLNYIAVVEELSKKLNHVDDHEIYQFRAKLAMALNGILDWVAFSPEKITFMLKGGGIMFFFYIRNRAYECSELHYAKEYVYDKDKVIENILKKIDVDRQILEEKGLI